MVSIDYRQYLILSRCLPVVCLLSSNIGKLARTIKSRVHPEENLVNRYMLAAGVMQRNRLYTSPEEAVDESEEHPLVPLGSVNSSSNQEVQEVRWPILGKNNSRLMFTRTHAKVSGRVFKRMIGAAACARNVNKPNSFKCQGTTTSAVQIGPWKFQTMPKPKKNKPVVVKPGTSHAYFAIRIRFVPHFMEWAARYPERAGEDFDPDKLLFGQFHRFVQLKIPQWNDADREHELGECTLWESLENQTGSDLPIIDLGDDLRLDDEAAVNRKVQYIPLQRVETIAAIGPVVQGWADRTKRGKVDKPAAHDSK